MNVWWSPLVLLALWSCARAASVGGGGDGGGAVDYASDAAVSRLREYIRINTSQPEHGDVDYTEAVAFWKRQAESLGLNASVYEYYSGKPVVVITWPGADPALPSIMLNSHMDVVAVDEEKWSHPPFGAHMDSDGNIYGRGTQDMKSVAIQYLEAIRLLMADNVTLARTVHMTMVPDEEIGGVHGMKAFVMSPEYKSLNVGFALDEGMATPDSEYIVFYAERSIWQFVVTCTGTTGHGSSLQGDTAADKLRKLINLVLQFRERQVAVTRAEPTRDVGTITSINLTKLSGGLATNIIPSALSATFDSRIGIGTNVTEFNQTVAGWLSEAGGEDCSLQNIRQEEAAPETSLDDSNPYWLAFKEAMDAMGLAVVPRVLPATSDMPQLRSRGVPALGFTAAAGTHRRLHAVDEYLHAAQLLRGVRIYVNILTRVANLE